MATITSYNKCDLTVLNFNQEAKAVYDRVSYDVIISDRVKYAGLFDYNCSEYNKDLLNFVGIPVGLQASRLHPHPVCKMLENFHLFNRVCSYLGKGRYWTVVSMKDEKFRRLQRLFHEDYGDFLNLVNRTPELVAKDFVRYSHDSIYSLDGSRKFLNDVVRDYPSSWGSNFERNFLLHDELHYWDRDRLEGFLVNNKVDNLLATVVFPIESICGQDFSANPSVYRFDVTKNSFGERVLRFMPDCQADGMYVQPMSFEWFFRCKYIRCRNGDVYTITKLCTTFAHHTFLIRKGFAKFEDDEFVFDQSDQLDTSVFERLGYKHAPKSIKYGYFMKIVPYLMSLKKPDVQSAVAKYRVQRGSEVDMAEIAFFEDLAMVLLVNGKTNLSDLNAARRLWERVIVGCDFAKYVFPKHYVRCVMLLALAEAKRKVFVIKRSNDRFFHDYLADAAVMISCYDPFVSKMTFEDRASTPYRLVLVDSYETMSPAVFYWRSTKNVGDIFLPELDICFGDLNYDPARLCSKRLSDQYSVVVGGTSYTRFGPSRVIVSWYGLINEALAGSVPARHLIRALLGVVGADLSSFNVKQGLRICAPVLKPEMNAETQEVIGSSPAIIAGSDSDTAVSDEDLKDRCYVVALAKSLGYRPNYVLKWFNDLLTGDSLSRHRAGLGLDLVEVSEVLAKRNRAVHCDVNGSIIVLGKENVEVRGKLVFADGNHLSCEGDAVSLNSLKELMGFDLVDYEVRHGAVESIQKYLNIGLTGVVTEGLVLDTHNSNFNANIWVKYGFAGCGKTKAVRDCLRNRNIKCAIVCPRRNLAEDWKREIGKKVDVFTFELFLRRDQSCYSLIVLDESTLYPPGYLDLVLSMLRRKNLSVQVALLGDPLQAHYHSYEDVYGLSDWALDPISADVRYRLYSYRCGPWLEEMIGVKSFVVGSKVPSLVSEASVYDGQGPILVADRKSKDTLSLQYPASSVLTFGESQGLTFSTGWILVNDSAFRASNAMFLVALTRFVERPKFLLPDKSVMERGKYGSASLLGGVLTGYCDVKKLFPVLEKMQVVGRFLRGFDNDKISADHLMHALLDDDRPTVDEPLIDGFEEEELVENHGKIHLPLATYAMKHAADEESLIDPAFRNVLPFENRALKAWNGKLEFRGYLGSVDHIVGLDHKNGLIKVYSEQFVPENAKVDNSLVPPDLSYQMLYPDHRHSDFMTYLAAVKKRLRFSSPSIEHQQYLKSYAAGESLFTSFMSVIPLRRLEVSDFVAGTKEFDENRYRKSAGTLMLHNNRSEPDWVDNHVDTFLKQQRCTKDENRAGMAKAGQTIACFNHYVLSKFGYWCKATEKMFQSVLPQNIYVHLGHSPQTMGRWIRDNYIVPDVCVESDYTAFDQSQDASVLNFEVLVLRFVGWPDDLINDYVQLKQLVGCRHGGLAIMRFTGEFSTFLFNTFANMAFTFKRYVLRPGIPMMFAGDDMVILGNTAVRRSKETDAFFSKLHLKAKVSFTLLPKFCGFYISPYGVVKKPRLIYDRLMIHLERNTLDLVLLSYFMEFIESYSFGDHLAMILSDDDLEYQQRLARFFSLNVKNFPKDFREGFKQPLKDMALSV